MALSGVPSANACAAADRKVVMVSVAPIGSLSMSCPATTSSSAPSACSRVAARWCIAERVPGASSS